MKQTLTITLFLLLTGSITKGQTTCADPGYTVPLKEINCFRHFEPNQQPGVSKVNNYLLSKISQLMYTERLDFELKKLRNPSGFPSAGFRSTDLNYSSNTNFECDFSKRFSHWFYDINNKPLRPVQLKTVNLNTANLNNTSGALNNNLSGLKAPTQTLNSSQIPVTTTARVTNTAAVLTPMEKFVQDSIAFEKSKPKFKFLNKRQDFINIADAIIIPGFDPEVMVVSTETYIIIAWRGTDNVYKEDSWEWIATDAYFVPTTGDGPLAGTKMHGGIWSSFRIIRTKLMQTLDAFEAKTKNKKIFITGHSLGGGVALISAPYLAGKGYNIGEVYTYASPRTVGDQAFVNKSESLLGTARIQRFEYGVDFVTKLWSPAIYSTTFKIPGHRHWLNASGADDDYNCAERIFPMTLNPGEYLGYDKMRIDKLNGDIGINLISVISYLTSATNNPTADRPKDARGFALLDCGNHNPGYYVKKAFENMTADQKTTLPAFVDTYPYLYPAVPGNK